MLKLLEDLALVQDGVYGAFGEYSGLGHFLHCKELLVFLTFHLPDLAEATLANSVLVGKLILSDCHVEL
jgi:hypothetical protein